MKKSTRAGWSARATAFAAMVGATAPLVGCGTSFEGEPRFPGGPRACYDRCAQEGMEMGSFVYVGEFATACACKPRVGSTQKSAVVDSEGAAMASAIGVELERRRIAATHFGLLGWSLSQ